MFFVGLSLAFGAGPTSSSEGAALRLGVEVPVGKEELNSFTGSSIEAAFDPFVNTGGGVRLNPAVLLPLPFLNFCTLLVKVVEEFCVAIDVLFLLALPLLVFLSSISLVGESHRRGGAQSCLVASNRVPTYVFPLQVTLTTRTPRIHLNYVTRTVEN